MTIRAFLKHLIPGLLLSVLLSPAGAQELEPRRWSHMPTGTHMAGGGYAYTSGDISFDPVLKLEGVEVGLHTVLAKYIQVFGIFGRSARIDLIQGYQRGHWEGLLDGEFAETDRSGLSDGIVRLSVNLLGAPPLQGQDFGAYRATAAAKETIVGAGLAVHVPTGRYYDEKLINLGNNRFVFRPQLGVVHNRGKWSTELTGAVWMFTDNGDFFNGNQLENAPLYTLEGHVVHTFRPGVWLSSGAGFGYGAESRDRRGEQRRPQREPPLGHQLRLSVFTPPGHQSRLPGRSNSDFGGIRHELSGCCSGLRLVERKDMATGDLTVQVRPPESPFIHLPDASYLTMAVCCVPVPPTTGDQWAALIFQAPFSFTNTCRARVK